MPFSKSKLLVITQGYGCYGWARAWLVGFDVQFWLGDSWKTLENLHDTPTKKKTCKHVYTVNHYKPHGFLRLFQPIQ